MTPSPQNPFHLTWSGFNLALERRTHIMGILNVTPDSFSDGGHFLQKEKAVAQGLAMVRDGADILDVGGESTRPYASEVSAGEELERVIPVIEALRKEVHIPISIDTMKADVAREALRAGASMVNDISALRYDSAMAEIVAEAQVPVILMHMKGIPKSMQEHPFYHHLLPEMIAFLREAMAEAVRRGIRQEMILIDPGIGFGKTFDHNLEIIRGLAQFHCLERPIVLGTSRKAFIGKILDRDPLDRDTGTMATVAAGVLNGAHIVRVHDVKKAVETVKIIDAVKRGKVHAILC